MNYAELYDESYGSIDIDFKQIERIISENNIKNIIEIGAGSGRLLPLYMKFDLNVTLVESSQDMLSILNERVCKLSNRFNVISGSSFSIAQIADCSYDLIIFAFASITEMSPLMFTISEATRVLTSNGILYFSAMNPNCAKTSAIGIDRAVMTNCKSTISAENTPIPSKGKNFFEVKFEVRSPNDHDSIIIEQVHPDYEYWAETLGAFGFGIQKIYGDFESCEFDVKTSPLIILVAIKNNNSITLTDNGAIAAKVYDSMAPTYEKISSGDHYKVPSWFADKMYKYKNYHPIVLDIGCATGTVGKVFSKIDLKPCYLFGTDISTAMVQKCRESGFYNAVACVDVSHGLFECKYLLYDVVCALGVLEFIADLDKVFSDIYKSLKLGGSFYFTLELSENNTGVENFNLPYGVFKKYSMSKVDSIALLQKHRFFINDVSIGEGYVSPSTGKKVDYLYFHVTRKNI